MKAETRKLRKQYRNLDDLERFRVVLAALARGDESEAKALADAAPKAIYKHARYPFAGMHDALLLCGFMAASDILGWGLLLAWEYARLLSKDDLTEEQEVELYDRAKVTARRVMAAWDGLAMFAGNLGLEADHALEYVPARARVDFAVALAEIVTDNANTTVLAALENQEEGEEIIREVEADLERVRQEAAREYADKLNELWEMKTE